MACFYLLKKIPLISIPVFVLNTHLGLHLPQLYSESDGHSSARSAQSDLLPGCHTFVSYQEYPENIQKVLQQLEMHGICVHTSHSLLSCVRQLNI